MLSTKKFKTTVPGKYGLVTPIELIRINFSIFCCLHTSTNNYVTTSSKILAVSFLFLYLFATEDTNNETFWPFGPFAKAKSTIDFIGSASNDFVAIFESFFSRA